MFCAQKLIYPCRNVSRIISHDYVSRTTKIGNNDVLRDHSRAPMEQNVPVQRQLVNIPARRRLALLPSPVASATVLGRTRRKSSTPLNGEYPPVEHARATH